MEGTVRLADCPLALHRALERFAAEDGTVNVCKLEVILHDHHFGSIGSRARAKLEAQRKSARRSGFAAMLLLLAALLVVGSVSSLVGGWNTHSDDPSERRARGDLSATPAFILLGDSDHATTEQQQQQQQQRPPQQPMPRRTRQLQTSCDCSQCAGAAAPPASPVSSGGGTADGDGDGDSADAGGGGDPPAPPPDAAAASPSAELTFEDLPEVIGYVGIVAAIASCIFCAVYCFIHRGCEISKLCG